ncbi:MAG: heme-binding protein, partial [Hyphomicrobiales bacterium]|nr:heme-binding protein [Hyphomicrobiales bacterium]
MKRQANLRKATLIRSTLLSAAAAVALLAPALAQAQDKAIYTKKFLSLSVALELAQAAMKNCQTKGFQVAVTVVDAAGIEQVTLRDRFAGLHTPSTALRKAWTAVSFR